MSKCCGFVTFRDVVCANRALANCPHYIDGNPVKLEPFRLQDAKKKRRKGRIRNRPAVTSLPKKSAVSNDVNADHQLVVDGLPPLPSVNDIRSLFGRFGAVIRVRVEEELHRAFVEFNTARALQMALAAPPTRLKCMKLRVSLHKDLGKSREYSNRNQMVADSAVPVPNWDRLGGINNLRAHVKTTAVTATTPCLKALNLHASLPKDHATTHVDSPPPVPRHDRWGESNNVRIPEKTKAVTAAPFCPQDLNLHPILPKAHAAIQVNSPPPVPRRYRLGENNLRACKMTAAVTRASPQLNDIGRWARLPKDCECR
ncbi:Heterogeneou nuclear ribonucleoprotein 27C, partial [Taenia solium]|eukprot:TsM_001052800 transcript=TsM_001052800 gene=TsM_001052800